MESKWIYKRKFLFLLITLLVFFLVNAIFVNTKADAYVFGVLFSILLLLCVIIVEKNRPLLVFVGGLAILTFLSHWFVNFFHTTKYVYIVGEGVHVLFFILVTIAVLIDVIKDKRITSNTLYGAMCGYLLIGLMWSFLFFVIYIFNPDAFFFAKLSITAHDLKFQQFVYYSFVTLTTLGYGDIVPVSMIAKTFAWMEAVTGQIYLTVWIAQLVGLHISQRYMKNIEIKKGDD